METIEEEVKNYFEENLSGEPLTQEAVEQALLDFALLQNEKYLIKLILSAIEFTVKINNKNY